MSGVVSGVPGPVNGVPGSGPALLLLAHGSRDHRSVSATRALARAVACAWPGLTVRHAFLDLSDPPAAPVLHRLRTEGHRDVVVVPLLLTAAYHSRVDVPAALRDAPSETTRANSDTVEWSRKVHFPVVRRAAVLGPDPRLLDALGRRLAPLGGFDALVLAAAGSSDGAAVASVAGAAAALGERFGVPARAGFASAATPVEQAVGELRAAGARRVAVASYFLAPGLLYDRVVAAASVAGAVGVAEPLLDIAELVDVVLSRFAAVAPAGITAAA